MPSVYHFVKVHSTDYLAHPKLNYKIRLLMIITERLHLNEKDWILLYHTILIGASALIPIPFLDDFVGTRLKRRLIYQLAKSYGKEIDENQVRQLAQQNNTGCSIGCVFTAVGYLFKELFRELFFWLEWGHSIDLATQAYYSGCLFKIIFESNDFDAKHSQIYGRAIQHAITGEKTEKIKGIFGNVFKSSKGILLDISKWLAQYVFYYLKHLLHHVWEIARMKLFKSQNYYNYNLKTRKNDDDNLDHFFEKRPPEIKKLVECIGENLKDGIGELPRDYFSHLRKIFLIELHYYDLAKDLQYE